MKNITLLIMFSRRALLVAVIVLSIFVVFGYGVKMSISKKNTHSCYTHKGNYKVRTEQIEEKYYTLLVANTPATWEYGLMKIKSKKDICGHDGMVFDFPVALPQTFWNKNTYIDLDVYWMNGEKVEGTSTLQSIDSIGPQTISSPVVVKKVVELVR